MRHTSPIISCEQNKIYDGNVLQSNDSTLGWLVGQIIAPRENHVKDKQFFNKTKHFFSFS